MGHDQAALAIISTASRAGAKRVRWRSRPATTSTSSRSPAHCIPRRAALEAARSGQGQTIDASICDGSALLAALVHGWRSAGLWNAEAGTNNGDSGAHFYDAYECADGHYVSIGAMEPPFYRLLREKCDLADPAFDAQWDQKRWPALKAQVAAAFKRKTRDEWCSLLEGSDVCFAPVLSLDEAPRHPHNKARGTFATVDGITQPSPAPRFSRTPPAVCQPVGEPGAETRSVLQECGFTDAEIDRLTPPQPSAGSE